MAKEVSTKASPLDFSSMTDEKFEDLIEAIFRAKTHHPDYGVVTLSRSGRGHDEGRDLLVTTLVVDCIASRPFKWLIQCKHKAKSRKSVQPSDFNKEFGFPDIVSHHGASGYLLVCSTRPSTKLQNHFDGLTKQQINPYLFIIWDYAKVCEEVNKHLEVMKLFFPEYYQYSQNLIDRSEIKKWAREYDDSICKEAKAALEQIV